MALDPEERQLLNECATGVTTLLERSAGQEKLCDERDEKVNARVDEVHKRITSVKQDVRKPSAVAGGASGMTGAVLIAVIKDFFGIGS